MVPLIRQCDLVSSLYKIISFPVILSSVASSGYKAKNHDKHYGTVTFITFCPCIWKKGPGMVWLLHFALHW